MSSVRPPRLSGWPVLVALAAFVVCVPWGSSLEASARAAQPPVLRLATTTSTVDTGLLAALIPGFEKRCGCRVDVIAVGTGQAIEIGRRGDADVLLVHARKAEDQFVAEGHARTRFDVMYNDFVVVGPALDPAGAGRFALAREAFGAIAKAGLPFVSRGDRSGTHTVELAIWAELKIAPAKAAWYRAVGQGMGETLVLANEQRAYALADRATWLAMSARLPELRLLLGGATLSQNRDATLRNDYGVIAVSAAKHPGVREALAARFVEWILAPDTQRAIGQFGVGRFGQPLYYPDSQEYKATREVAVLVGGRSRTFTEAELRALPRVSLSRHEVVGVKKGPLGRFTWTGASLRDLLLRVEPTLAGRRHAGSRVVVSSSDGWRVTLWWEELFGRVPAGLGLYNVKGCNECHGVEAEGTAPTGKRPAPRLAGQRWPVEETLALLAAGRDLHGGLNPYTADQLSRAELVAVLGWLQDPAAAARGAAFRPPAARAAILLAYERDGRPMGGAEGLLHLVVGPDEFAGRYSHWVSTIEVVPAGR